MQWFVTNWFWVVIGVAFVWMHLGGHGGHGGHGGQDRPQRTGGGDTRESSVRETTGTPGGHQH